MDSQPSSGAESETTEHDAVQGRSAWRASLAEYAGLALALAVIITVFGLSAEHFLSLTTLRTIANQIPDAMVVAAGMTLVMIVGGIDLSVGSVLALSSAVLGLCLVDLHLPLPISIAACLLAGFVCGLINGFVTVHWRLPSFIVTLGMMEIARGGAYLATHSQTKYIGASIERISEASWFGLSFPFLLALAVIAAGQFVLHRTVWGRYVFAIGANEEVVRLSGVSVRPVKISVFALSGTLAAVAAIIQTARLSSADPNAGAGFELNTIAACVIGGVSLLGGRGSIVSSFFGVLIIAALSAGLAHVGAQEPTKRLVTGCVIVAAVIVDVYRVRLSRSG